MTKVTCGPRKESPNVVSEDFWSEWDIETTVCLTHMRFIPCRADDGCVFSVDPQHIELVQKYQWGDTPH